MPQTNPFSSLSIKRVLQITYEDDLQPCHRPLHPPWFIYLTRACVPCVLKEPFALITHSQSINDTLLNQYPIAGVVHNVL